MNNNDKSDNMDFSDNYDDNSFFNENEKSKSDKKDSVDIKKQYTLIHKIKSNEIAESINDEYDDVDWGEKQESIESKE